MRGDAYLKVPMVAQVAPDWEQVAGVGIELPELDHSMKGNVQYFPIIFAF